MQQLGAQVAEFLQQHPQFRDNCGSMLRHDESFARFAQIPGLLDMVEQLIGPDLALWNMSLFAKPPLDGKATPWHQDGEYWPIRPLATCTVWIAIDDAKPKNGCLRVIRGSHRARKLAPHHSNPSPDVTLHQELNSDTFDERDAVDLVLRRGQISLHDVYLMHGSEPNRSPHRRRGITMRLMPTTSHYSREVATQMHRERDGNNLTDNPVLLLRGQDRCGRTQFAQLEAPSLMPV